MPFNIYHNLLMSCFIDLKIYKNVFNLEYFDKKDCVYALDTITDNISNKLIDTLLQNSFINHIILHIMNDKLEIRDKIYAIKCLLILLSTRKKVIEIFWVISMSFSRYF
ncbi:hypothetical protein MXB_2293, partial [Myxobolus squamalis]